MAEFFLLTTKGWFDSFITPAPGISVVDKPLKTIAGSIQTSVKLLGIAKHASTVLIHETKHFTDMIFATSKMNYLLPTQAETGVDSRAKEMKA